MKTEHIALAVVAYLFLSKPKAAQSLGGASTGSGVFPAANQSYYFPDSGLITGGGTEQTTEQSEIPQYYVDPKTGNTEYISPYEEPSAEARHNIFHSTGATWVSGRGFISAEGTIRANAAETLQKVSEQAEFPVQGRTVAQTFPNLPPAEEVAIAGAIALPFIPSFLRFPAIGATAVYEVATQMTPQAIVDTSINVAKAAAGAIIPAFRPAVQTFDLFKDFFGWK